MFETAKTFHSCFSCFVLVLYNLNYAGTITQTLDCLASLEVYCGVPLFWRIKNPFLFIINNNKSSN